MSTDHHGSIADRAAEYGSAAEAAFLAWLNEYTRTEAEPGQTAWDSLRAAFMAGRADLEEVKALLGSELQSANAVIMRQMAGTASVAEVYADLQQLIKDYSVPGRDVIALVPFAATLDQLFGEKYGFES